MFGINEERSTTRKQDRASVDLVQLINTSGDDLRVISVWGAGGGVGQTSAIRAAYESPNVKLNFPCRASEQWRLLLRNLISLGEIT
jgi:hypothetical protein